MSTEVSLVQKRIGEFLCEDLSRGKDCPKCADKAAKLYQLVLMAQELERKHNRSSELERMAGFIEGLNLDTIGGK